MAQADDLEKTATALELSASYLSAAIATIDGLAGQSRRVLGLEASRQVMLREAGSLRIEVDDYRRDSVDMGRGD